ncbi:STAS domain-containing protein [Streptomyces sp. MST-110588]|uniref:STAS domain-containing protein n=1 Tax=Streptomyces sp. MST-110588 TaxID=2833628 RepID=UPI001F5D9814|nr:STAS domain-containing protein [Streptomyces sp. MST-110588]UNO38568.1 STAS domain-containing protein [Streptomyces sp. MST-110588]
MPFTRSVRTAFPATGQPATYARTRLVDGWTVVTLHGEIDVATAPLAEAHLKAAARHPGPRVVVDLRPADFIDCATLGLLCRIRQRIHEQGGQLRLVCVRAQHLHLLGITGLSSLFRPVATLEEACAGGLPVRGGEAGGPTTAIE